MVKKLLSLILVFVFLSACAGEAAPSFAPALAVSGEFCIIEKYDGAGVMVQKWRIPCPVEQPPTEPPPTVTASPQPSETPSPTPSPTSAASDIVLAPGTYTGVMRFATSNQTIRAYGAIVDGSVIVNASGVTIIGLTVRNSPGKGIDVIGANVTLRDVTVTGDLVLSVGSGDRTQETTQSAGKDVGVSGLAAQATDNAVGVGGGATVRIIARAYSRAVSMSGRPYRGRSASGRRPWSRSSSNGAMGSLSGVRGWLRSWSGWPARSTSASG
jgi:hypothetical protein